MEKSPDTYLSQAHSGRALSFMPQEMLTFLVHRLLEPEGVMQVYSPNPETRLLTLTFLQ